MQELQYPLSAFKHVFERLAAATHLRFSVPDSTLDWLSQLSSDGPQRTTSGFTTEEQLVLKQDYGQLFYMLLRIIMPNDARPTIDIAECADRQKWAHVDQHEFEDAANCKEQQDIAFASLADFVADDNEVLPAHLQKLFDLLAIESTS